MHDLHTISVHNWYLIDAKDIEIRGHTAIIGATGAGKSSLMDAIQTAVSGNNRNVIDLNASAGERSDRTVRDYVLGRVSDVENGRPARDACESTIALSFRERGTDRWVSFGVMLSASVDDAREDTVRFVCKGHHFRIEDHVEIGPDGAERVMSHERIRAALKTKLGAKGFVVHPTSKGYVEDYLHAMRPGRPPRADHFLRAFGNTLKAKEFTDPTAFVRSFVLEPVDLDVKGVQDGIRLWREMEAMVERLERVLREMDPIRKRFEDGFKREIESQTDAFLVAHTERLAREADVERLALAKREAEEAKDIGERIVANHQTAMDNLRDEISTYRAALKEKGQSGQAARIQADIQAAMLAEATAGQKIALVVPRLLGLADLAAVRDSLASRFGTPLASAEEFRRTLAGARPQDISPLAETLVPLARSAALLIGAEDSLQAQRDDAAAAVAALESRLSGIDRELHGADTSGTVVSRGVSDYVARLRARGIQPTLLQAVVDVADASWANALEGVLGGAAEAVIVPPDDVEEAHAVLKLHRQEVGNCILVDSKRLRTRRKPARPGSLAEVAATDHPDARAFLDDRLGHIIRVESPSDFGRFDFSILRDGRQSGGNTRTVAQPRRLVLGKASQALSIEALRAERGKIAASIAEARTRRDRLAQALLRLAAARDIDIGALDGWMGEAHDAARRAASLRRQIATIGNDDHDGLQEGIRENEAALAEYKAEIDEAHRSIRVAEGNLGEIRSKEREAIEAAGRFKSDEARLREAQQGTRPRWLIETLGLSNDAIGLAEERIANQSALAVARGEKRTGFLKAETKITQDRIRERERDRDRQPTVMLGRASNALNEAMATSWDESHRFAAEADELERYGWLVRRQEMIADNDLLRRRAEVAAARQSMERSLKEGLLTKLGEAFSDLDRQIRALNEALGGRTLIGQRYQFSKTLDQSLRPLHDLVKKIVGSPNHDLFSAGPPREGLDEEIAEGLRRVEELILADGSDTRRLSDYRNYFTFEMNLVGTTTVGHEKAPDAFSKLIGVLSGGQREVPYYVAIAASMSKTYFPQARRTDQDHEGMGLLLFDEAFSKLDIKNTQQLMRLFSDLGLQVVAAAPEDKRISLAECADTMVNVTRANGSDLYVESVTIGAAARRAMAEQNPVHGGIEAFRPPVAAE